MEPDYYKVLGVSPDSEDIVIQAAYRALMRRYHPDKNPPEAARKKAVEINAAYAVIGDTAQRASYDASRKTREQSAKASASKSKSSPPPPPPPTPPPPQSKAATSPPAGSVPIVPRRQSGGLIFASILTIFILAVVGLSGSNSTNSAGLNTMNVDENLTTTDMNTAVDMNAMNATDMNAVEAVPPDLSKQSQTAVSYSTIEGSANRFAKIITTKGITGARAYSDSCHKSVQTKPSWDAADGCAAFDFAAAYIDDAVSTQNGWPKDGYFQFQSANEADNYASVGAPTYVTSDRLSKIRAAAQSAALEAYRIELARQDTLRRMRDNQRSSASPAAATDNSSD